MRQSITIAIIIGMALGSPLSAAASDPSAGWIGKKVFPKEHCEVKSDNGVVDTRDWAVPWIVQQVRESSFLVGDKAKGWVDRGQVVTQDEAPTYFNELIRTDPNNMAAYNMRALVWMGAGKVELAIADYGEVIHRFPKEAIPYNNRGGVWMQEKEYDKAIADFTEAIRIDPHYAIAYCNRGGAWSKKKEYDKAIADCNEAIRLNPKYAHAYGNRGTAWRMKEEFAKAIADFDASLRLYPNDKLTSAKRAEALEKMGAHDKTK
jgi:tetratricopeptide (TPR) repeat protein